MDYEVAIKEKIEELNRLEKTTKDLKGRDWIRFLRLLKSGEAGSQLQAGRMIGLNVFTGIESGGKILLGTKKRVSQSNI